mgnify:CR=1 FL=1
MADMRSAFGGGEYLGAKDLKGETTVTISAVSTEQVRTEEGLSDKWVVSFQGAKRRLILNVTNNNTLIDAFGYESNDWIGQTVTLFVADVQFKERMVKGLRIRTGKVVIEDEVQAQAQAVQHKPVAEADIPF